MPISLLNEVYLIFKTATRSLAHLKSVPHLLNGSENSGRHLSDSFKRDNKLTIRPHGAHTQPSPGKGSVHCCFWSLFLLPCRAKFVHSFPSTNRIETSTLHAAPVNCCAHTKDRIIHQMCNQFHILALRTILSCWVMCY